MHTDRHVIATARRIGTTIRTRREDAPLTQAELALVAGLSERTVHAIEHSKPNARLSAVIAMLHQLNLDLVAQRQQRRPGSYLREPDRCPTCGLVDDRDDEPPGRHDDRRSPTP